MILAATVATASDLRAQPTADAAAIPSTDADGSEPKRPVLTPRSAPEQDQHAAAATASTREPAWRIRLTDRRRPLTRPGDHGTGAYVGLNIIAPFTAIRSPIATTYLAFVSDLESGLAVQVGYFFDSWQAIDARFSVGPTNSIYTQWQFHAAYDLYLLDLLKITHKGLYLGPQLRLWDLVHVPFGTHDFSFVPAVHLGYRWEVRGFYVDVRITQTLAALSWSTRPATGVGVSSMLSVYPSFSPVIPMLGLTLGYRFRTRCF